MIRMNNVAGIILLVNELEVSADFYQKLGFTVTKKVPDTAITVSFGSFWIELLHKSKVVSEEYTEDIPNPQKGAGIYLQIQVDNTDRYFEEISNKGIMPAGSPRNFPWNHREFIVVDPDGYKLAFFNSI